MSAELNAHVALTAAIDAEGDLLDQMECDRSAGHHVDHEHYAEVEERWAALLDQRAPLDDAILAEPITSTSHIRYLADTVTRMAELAPERAIELIRQFAGNLMTSAEAIAADVS